MALAKLPVLRARAAGPPSRRSSASSEPNESPSSASRPRRRVASWSAVACDRWRAASRARARSPSKAPIWVCVLPMSTASSIGRLSGSGRRTRRQAARIHSVCRWEAKLYVIPGSHPSLTARLMLERKGIPYKRIDLMPVVSKGVLEALRFPGNTVPALKIDGRRIQGSREIARELDRIQPEPPLFPEDAGARAKVEEAEAWGDDFQEKPRRVAWCGAAAQPPAARQLLRRRPSRHPDRACGQDGPADRRRRREAQRGHRRERPGRPCVASGGPGPNRRLDRRAG